MDRWTQSTSNRRRATFNRRRATFNRRPGIKMNFRQTVELYLWILGDSRNETRAANNNISAQSSDDIALERMKESNGDSSLSAENKTSKQDLSKTGKLLSAIEVTMAGVQCRQPNVKSKLTFGEKLYNRTTGALKQRGEQPDTKTIHTRTGAERASEWIIPEMVTCSSVCHTKTAYEGTSKKTLKASQKHTMYHTKSCLLFSGDSDPKRSSSEPTMYGIEFPYIGIKEDLVTCRASSEYTKYLAESSAEGSLKSVAPKRAASCPAVIYAKPTNGGIPAGFFPKDITDPQGSRKSNLSYTMKAADGVEESIVQKGISKSKLQYIKPAEVCIPDGTVPKKLLSVSGNKSADEDDGEGVEQKLVLSERALCYTNSIENLTPKRAKSDSTTYNIKPHVETSQEASNGTTWGQYSSAADIAENKSVDEGDREGVDPRLVLSECALAAAADIGASVCENLRSQSRKSRRNTERKRDLRRENSEKKKGVTSCFYCYPR